MNSPNKAQIVNLVLRLRAKGTDVDPSYLSRYYGVDTDDGETIMGEMKRRGIIDKVWPTKPNYY